MKKPKWMNSNAFAAFFEHHKNAEGHLDCKLCGISETKSMMTVDHIFPRIKGGKDDLSNLQPLCISCNSAKRDRPDKYWNRRFYFDFSIDKSRLRVSQSDFVMVPIEDNFRNCG